eukprot:TRINITY_DN4381_c0_g1_i1.p1 TRINITY_DN4381_c0_g1~~TRINITY_DN4381_c0_g1_i1.p1  ORF type:complete len:554 (-),score=98.26 TRINITY_DN4381_c0_g1_i1:164-1825(-)
MATPASDVIGANADEPTGARADGINLDSLTEEERALVLHEMHMDTNTHVVHVRELLKTMHEKQKEEKTVKYLTIALCLLCVYATGVTAAGFGLTTLAVNRAKDTIVDKETGMEKVKDGSVHIHTALAHLDFKLMDSPVLPFDTLREMKQLTLVYDKGITDFRVTGFQWYDYNSIDFFSDSHTIRIDGDGIKVRPQTDAEWLLVVPRQWSALTRTMRISEDDLAPVRNYLVTHFGIEVIGPNATEASIDIYFKRFLKTLKSAFRFKGWITNEPESCRAETLEFLPRLWQDDRYSKSPLCQGPFEGCAPHQDGGSRKVSRPWQWLLERSKVYTMAPGTTETNMVGNFRSKMAASTLAEDTAYITEALLANANNRSKVCEEYYKLVDPRNGGGDIETLVGTTEELLGAWERRNAMMTNVEGPRFEKVSSTNMAETAAKLLIDEIEFWSKASSNATDPLPPGCCTPLKEWRPHELWRTGLWGPRVKDSFPWEAEEGWALEEEGGGEAEEGGQEAGGEVETGEEAGEGEEGGGEEGGEVETGEEPGEGGARRMQLRKS